MRAVGPMLLLASGVGVAAFVHLQDVQDRATRPASIAPLPGPERESAPVIPAVSPEPRRVFAPQSQHFTASVQDRGREASTEGAGGGSPPTPVPGLAPVPAKRAAPTTWTTVVSAYPGAPSKARERSGSGGDLARYELARDLQRGLKQAGCYYGDVDGDWGPGSKRAMTEFAERVNASLPVEEPDLVLLALVQAHTGVVCGRTCPAGQGLGSDGRCLPHAILAQAEKKSSGRQGDRKSAEIIEREKKAALERLARAGERTGAAQAGSAFRPASPPLPGRMSVGGPETGAGAAAPSVIGASPGLAVPAEQAATEGPSGPEGAQSGREATVIEPAPVAAPPRAKRPRAAQKPPRYAERPSSRQRTLIYNLFHSIERVN